MGGNNVPELCRGIEIEQCGAKESEDKRSNVTLHWVKRNTQGKSCTWWKRKKVTPGIKKRNKRCLMFAGKIHINKKGLHSGCESDKYRGK